VLRRLGEEVERFLRAGKAPVLMGGEHTLTLGAVQGAAAVLGGLQVLALDAHSDLRDEYAGERICHATVLRRVAEVADRLVIVGARSFFGPEVDEPLFALPEEFTAHLDAALPLWLTVDLDALDPALCPGVTNPEPGGLSYVQVIEIFRKLQGFRVVGMDVVELAPPFDPTGTGAVVAAKLLLEAICAFWAPKRPCA
jgi:agmatinase